MTSGAGPTIRCVGALIYDSVGRLLLIERATDPGAGRWSIPGGRVAPGETDPRAVIREVAEETGLIVTVEALCGTVTRPAPAGTFVIYDYFCAVTGGHPVAGTDAAALDWVDAATFDELDRTGRLVDQLAATLRDWQALPRR